MDQMTFEQAEQLLTPAQKDRIARCLWEELRLPQGLNEVEKAFAFGLYTFVQYEDKQALRRYFAQEEPESIRPEPCAENPDLLENKHTEPVGMGYTQTVPETPPAPAPRPQPAPGPGLPKGERPMYPCIKNIPHESAQDLAALVTVQPGQIVSRTLAQNPAVSLTLFAFAEGEEISTHSSEGDAMVQVLEGTGQFTVDGTDHLLGAGQVLVMPAGKPHAVYAPRPFKMLLTVVFPARQ